MKMKVKYWWKGEYQGKHKVSVKETSGDFTKVKVKDCSEDLYPEYRNKKVCSVTRTPDLDMIIKFKDGKTITIDVCQAQQLMSALMCYEQQYETTWDIKGGSC